MNGYDHESEKHDEMHIYRKPEKVPLPTPVPPKKNKCLLMPKLYFAASFLIPLGTVFIGLGVVLPFWLDVKVMNFLTIVKDYREGLWQRCDQKTCEKRIEADLKGYEVATRGLMVLSLLTGIAANFLMILAVCVQATAEKTIVHIVTFADCYASAIFSLLALMIYAAGVKPSRAYWLSYAYYLSVMGAFIMLGCGFLLSFHMYRKWKEHKRPPVNYRTDDHYDEREYDGSVSNASSI